MKRLYLFAFLFLFLISPLTSFAQENVSVRLGDRDDFARLVFGWNSAVTYTRSDNSDRSIILSFDKGATIENIDTGAFGYIDGFQIISTQPLKVQLNVAQGTKVRDFKIGRRVILDIHKPEGFENTQSVAIEQKEVVKPSVKPAQNNETPQEIEQAKAPDQNVQKDKTAKSDMPAVPPTPVSKIEKLQELAIVETAETEKPQVKEDKPKTPPPPQMSQSLKSAVEEENHIISVRSTQRVNVAAFENYGKMWFVFNDEAAYVLPELTSPEPDLFSDMYRETVDGAQAYSIIMPEQDFPMKATGGGLVWNLIMGDKVKEGKPVTPRREFETTHSTKEGKMIWPMKYVAEIVDVTDPITGQTLKTILVEDASQFSGAAKSYTDFDVLESPIGMTIRPKVDDLVVKQTGKGIEVYRPNGLTLAPAKEIEAAKIFINQNREKLNKEHGKTEEDHTEDKGTSASHGKENHKDAKDQSYFNFSDWVMDSTPETLPQKKTVILSSLNGKSEARQIEDLLTLGKMFLSYGRGAEALGFFNYAASELPELNKSPEFRALSGVSKALDWKSEEALQDLSYPALDDIDEVKYWKSYVLADLGDWEQAAKILPDHFSKIYNYPHNISSRLALVLAEISLRDGKVKQADELITLVEHHKDELLPPFVAYLKYLKGEAERQKGRLDNAKDLWEQLSKGRDDLYRTKSGLALTILKGNENELDNEQMIDALERLRYAWRGDELEAQVKYWLGKAYFQKRDFLKGLHTMRDGAGIASGTILGERIAGEMSGAFSDLFLKDELKGISPLEAVALYDEFSELTPLGKEGNKLVQVLAEHLVNADLLPRASKILSHQIDHRLEGAEKVRVAIRLAAIELMDKDPQGAVNALAKATGELKRISDKETKDRFIRDIAILKTKAYMQNKQYEKALSLVENIPDGKDVRRLRADITWQAGYWGDAADALRTIMIDEGITGDRPLTNAEADMVLNRAVALSLDNDRIALSSLRQKYLGAMKDTYKARQFEVISRPRKDGSLADRETLLSVVSEVDMFKEFLDDYRNGDDIDLPAANNGKALHQ